MRGLKTVTRPENRCGSSRVLHDAGPPQSRFFKHRKTRVGQSGFTLIDTAIFMVIFSLFLIPFFQLQQIHKGKKETKEGAYTVEDISIKLTRFALERGAYPVPANPSLAMTDPMAGHPVAPILGFLSADGSPEKIAALAAIPPVAACNGGAATNGVLCRPGARDLDSPTNGISGNNEAILIGTLPYSALGLSPEQGLDAYGRKYLYAVSRALIDPTTFDNEFGQVGLAIHQAGTTNIGWPSNLHFAVVSAGPDGLGAYSRQANGTFARSTPCPSSGSAWQRENCNDDFRFKSIRTTTSTTDSASGRNIGAAAGDTFFDDVVYYSATIFGDEWTPRDAVVPTENDMVYLTSVGGKVGINMAGVNPSSTLQVMGDAKAKDIKTEGLCNAGQSECITTTAIMNADRTRTTNSMLCTGLEMGLRAVTIGNATVRPTRTCDAFTKVSAIKVNASDPSGVCPNGASSFGAGGQLVCK